MPERCGSTGTADDVHHRLGNYYTCFDKNSKCKFLCFGEFKMDTLDKREKILVLNSYTEYLSGLNINDFPYYAKDTVIRDSLVYKNNDLNISVYRLSDKLIQARKETIIFQSKNDFEKPAP
jgi:hypothetical protein